MTKDYIIGTTCTECEGEGGFITTDDGINVAPYLKKCSNPSCTEGKVKERLVLRKKCDSCHYGCGYYLESCIVCKGKGKEGYRAGEDMDYYEETCTNCRGQKHFKRDCRTCKGIGYIERFMTVQEAEEIGLAGALPMVIKATINELIKRKHKINGWTITGLVEIKEIKL